MLKRFFGLLMLCMMYSLAMPGGSSGSTNNPATETTTTDAVTDLGVTTAASTTNTTIPAPSAPSDLSVQTTSTTANLTWIAPDGDVTGYFIYYGLVSDDELVKVNEVPSPSTNYKVDCLVSNSAYKFAVSSQFADAESERSDVIKANTTLTKPTEIDVEIKSLSNVEIQWTPIDVGGGVMKVENYIIFWSSIFGKENTSVNTTYCSVYTCTFYITADWQPNTEYEVQVAAESSASVLGDVSDAVYRTTAFGPPSNVTVASSTLSTMNIIWNSPDIGGGARVIEYYQIVLDPVDENGQKSFSTSDDTTHIEISNLSPNTQYSSTVSASVVIDDKVGAGAPSEKAFGWTVPGSPGNVSIEYGEVNTTEVEVKFVKPQNGATQYESRFIAASGVEKRFSSTNSPIEAFNLKPGETYDVYVRANNSAGYGLDSESKKITMVPLPVVDLKVENVTDNFVSISWNISQDDFKFDSQVVQYTFRNNSKQDVIDNNTFSHKIENLASGAEYLIEVFTKSNNVRSEPRVVVEVTELLGVLGLRAETQTTTSIEIAWEAPPARLNFDNYSITYDPSDTDFTAIIVPAPASSTNITGLNPGTLYKVSITCIGIVESDTVVKYLPTSPYPVEQLEASATSSNSVTVTWEEPAQGGFYGFEVYAVNGSNLIQNITVDTNTTMTTELDNLSPGTKYDVCSEVVFYGVRSRPVCQEDTPTNPAPVTNLTVPHVAEENVVDISWSKPSIGSIDYYAVSFENSKGDIEEAATSKLSYSFNAEYGEKYDVRVLSVFANLNSTEEPATTVISPLAADNVNSYPSSTTVLTVSWTHPSGTVGEYEVYAELNGTLIGDNTTVAGDAQTAAIPGLHPGTYYNVFVKSFSFNVEGPAANITQVPTVPNPPMSLDVNDTFPGNVTSISWSPPNTGSAEYYIITYSDVQTSNVFENETSVKTSYELTVEYGSKYTIEVFSVFGGYKNAEAVNGVTTTYPDSVKELKINQNKNSPSTTLDLAWIKPSGNGDVIQIEYSDYRSSATETANFNDTGSTVSVEPGYNYTANVKVISNNLQSETQSVQVNSKPNQPQYVVIVGVNNLILSWEFPNGNYEGFIATCEGQRFYVDKTEKSHTCSGLNPNSQYTVDVNSWITDINGAEETSLVKETSHATGSASPAPANSSVELSTNGKQTPNAITFLLPEGTFTDKNGPIEYYAVYITLADNTDKTTSGPDLTRRDSCQNLGGETKECVSLWYDVRELDTNSRRKRSFDDPAPNPPISFIIGNGSESTSPWNESFINYKLQPNTDYQVSVAAKTSNDEMTAMNWSVVIPTSK
ncbi:tenascin-N-like [Clavelina lepadiformis]|uniref:tenascin-N-like n=1 Tax=Clavelina lepadiformis TaxID=159417 RepID=UPI004042084E